MRALADADPPGDEGGARQAGVRERGLHLVDLCRVQAVDEAGDVGLLAEEYDPVAGRQLGNFSQPFSHVPLINTAMHLSEAGPDPRYLRFENESEDAAR